MQITKKVRVYFNLHERCYSIQQNGLVVGYADNLVIKNAQFQVQPAGNKRVRKETRKNVHAFVVGYLDNKPVKKGIEVEYNPYLYENFVTKIDHKIVRSAGRVGLSLTKEKKAKILAIEIE